MIKAHWDKDTGIVTGYSIVGLAEADYIETEIAEEEIYNYKVVAGKLVPRTEKDLLSEAKARSGQRLRAARNNELRDTDYLMVSDFPLTENERIDLLGYRKSLRDMTNNEVWETVGLPDVPETVSKYKGDKRR